MICKCGHMDEQHVTASDGIKCVGCEEQGGPMDPHHAFQDRQAPAVQEQLRARLWGAWWAKG